MTQAGAGRFAVRSGCRVTVDYDQRRNRILLLDQRLLPHQAHLLRADTFTKTAEAIRDMAVRGAGAIAATAAFGLAQGARQFPGRNLILFWRHCDLVAQTLIATRPTAVDPRNAVGTVLRKMRPGRTVRKCQALAVAAAIEFAAENVSHCRALGLAAEHLVREGAGILTHCNAGRLAFVDIGSATAPLYAAHARGRKFHVFCDETRPRCQGSTLTAWEFSEAGIAHSIIADNAAGHLMQRGEIQMVIVGADRVLGRTGEVANKIGTYTKAVLAARHGIPFYVAIPLSTIDWELRSGSEIPIEERNEDEVLGAWGINRAGRRDYVRIGNPASHARNPGFDVTPAELITGIITPVGILPPRSLWCRRKELGG